MDWGRYYIRALSALFILRLEERKNIKGSGKIGTGSSLLIVSK